MKLFGTICVLARRYMESLCILLRGALYELRRIPHRQHKQGLCPAGSMSQSLGIKMSPSLVAPLDDRSVLQVGAQVKGAHLLGAFASWGEWPSRCQGGKQAKGKYSLSACSRLFRFRRQV